MHPIFEIMVSDLGGQDRDLNQQIRRSIRTLAPASRDLPVCVELDGAGFDRAAPARSLRTSFKTPSLPSARPPLPRILSPRVSGTRGSVTSILQRGVISILL